MLVWLLLYWTCAIYYVHELSMLCTVTFFVDIEHMHKCSLVPLYLFFHTLRCQETLVCILCDIIIMQYVFRQFKGSKHPLHYLLPPLYVYLFEWFYGLHMHVSFYADKPFAVFETLYYTVFGISFSVYVFLATIFCGSVYVWDKWVTVFFMSFWYVNCVMQLHCIFLTIWLFFITSYLMSWKILACFPYAK